MLSKLKGFWADEEGVETVEILMILGVLVAIAVVFRNSIYAWMTKLLTNANKDLDANPIDNKPVVPTVTTN